MERQRQAITINNVWVFFFLLVSLYFYLLNVSDYLPVFKRSSLNHLPLPSLNPRFGMRVQLFLCLNTLFLFCFVFFTSLTIRSKLQTAGTQWAALAHKGHTREPQQESINTQTNKRKAYANITAHTRAVKRQLPPPLPSFCVPWWLKMKPRTTGRHTNTSTESQRANRLRHIWLQSLTHITIQLMLSGHKLRWWKVITDIL